MTQRNNEPLFATLFSMHSSLHETLARRCGVSLAAFDSDGYLRALHGKAFSQSRVERFVIGQHIDEIFGDSPEHAKLYWHALTRGECCDTYFRSQDRVFDVHITPITSPEGRIEGVVGLATDVSTSLQGNPQPSDSEHQLTNLLSTSPDGIFIINKDFVILRHNPIVTEVNTPGPIIGEVCHKRFFDFDEPCPYCPVKETFRTGRPARSACYHDRLDMHFSLSATPLFDLNTGELVGAFETFRDITDLHTFEEAVRSHERGQLLLDAIPLCCCLFDEHLTMLDCNQEALKFLQCTTKEDAAAKALYFFPEHQLDGSASREHMITIMRTAFDQKFTRVRWEFAIGARQHVPTEVTFIPVNYGDRTLLAAYVRDLTEEEAMKSEVEAANERIKVMFNSAPLGCTMTDKNFQAIDCNNEILRMHGLTDKVYYCERFFELSPEYQPCGSLSGPLAAMHLNKAFDEGYDRFEWMHRTIDGEPLPVEITIVRVMVRDEPRVAGYVRDLRELKKTQSDLDRERAELVLAKEAAEAASHTKSTFLANMSHEIRTPMNAILGLAYLALQSSMPSAQRDTFLKIHAAATGLLGVINDILDFSKIEAHKLNLEVAPFSLSQQLHGILDIIRFKATEKNIDLSFQMSPELQSVDVVLGDAARLRQILINLLGNAVKFTEKGGVLLEVENLPVPEHVKPKLSPDCTSLWLRFSVFDTGIGISPESQQFLFQPFSQADGSITRRFGGTGLGLAISRQLVELMGGEVRLESEVGYGSIFQFCLLFVVGELPSLPVPRQSLSSDNMHLLCGKRVLLVEDNDINQLIAQSLLEQAEIVVRIADNGKEALRMVEEEEFDLILMDIQMPIMDGLEATRRIRRHRAPLFAGLGGDPLPIVAMTAHAMSDDHDKSLAAGMNDHITKPIEPEYLYSTLLRWMA